MNEPAVASRVPSSRAGACVALLALLGALAGVASIAEAQPFAYVVVHQYTDGVTLIDGPQHLVVIDTATRTRVDSIPLEAGCANSSVPKGLVATPTGSRLFVINCGSRTISVVDTVTRRVVSSIPIGPAPSPYAPAPALAMSPDGTRLYVLRGHDIVVIDPRTLGQLATLSTRVLAPFYVPDLLVSPDGQRLFLSDVLQNRVAILDALSGAPLGLITVPGGLVFMALSRDGSTLYGTRNDQTLYIVNTATRTLAGTIAVGISRSVFITPDDNQVWVPESNSCPFRAANRIVQRSTHTTLGGFETTCDPKSLAFTPDGTLAFVSVFEHVEVTDTRSGQRLDRIRIEDIGEGRTNGVLIPPLPPPPPEPPTNLIVQSIRGLEVTLRWSPPPAGPAPTSYVLEGGVSPGETLATIPTGSANPIFTFTAPRGSFHVRLHALNGTSRSAASNEVALVLVPSPAPSAPADLTGLANASMLWLNWRNTFTGGTPDGLLLDVTGTLALTLPMPLADSFTFSGVPAGTYTLRLRAINTAGSSASSNAVTLTFPSGCTGVPAAPLNVTVTRSGRTLFLAWDPAPTGPATTGFVVHVSGAFTASLPTSQRTMGGAVAPGSYGLSVSGTNVCGQGAATPLQVVTVP